MQIDFHHGVTYVVARLAGFKQAEAQIIAYCAQYVDDATDDGLLSFDNGALYRRLATAHKMLDYKNFESLGQHLVWVPFHFLPGNAGLPAGENPEGSFIEKLVCRPNSHVAADMVRHAFEDRNKPYGLHRLGVTAHVFVDTWAHQGFAGVNHDVNRVRDMDGPTPTFGRSFKERVADYFGENLNDAVPPIGHGPALSCPDMPYLEWSYTDGLGRVVKRDNPTDFTAAANALYKVFKRWIEGDCDAPVDDMPQASLDKLNSMFKSIRETEGEMRHRQWLLAIANDEFGFGPETLTYVPEGHTSWRHLALGKAGAWDNVMGEYEFSAAFLTSNWKMFHNAAKAHRLAVVDEILPRYGICAA